MHYDNMRALREMRKHYNKLTVLRSKWLKNRKRKPITERMKK